MFRLLNVSGSMVKHSIAGIFKDKKEDIREKLNHQGGVFSKLAQLMTLDDSESTVFEATKPLNPGKTQEAVMELKHDTQTWLNVEEKASWYGSVGQVHRGVLLDMPKDMDLEYANAEDIPLYVVVKFRYHGLSKVVEQDLKILRKTVKVYAKENEKYKQVLMDVEETLKNEQNFLREMDNTNQVYEVFKDDPCIVIPRAFKVVEKPNTSVLILEQIMGTRLSAWLKQPNVSQMHKNVIGKLIVKFVYTLLNQHNIVYTDAHWTNFLVVEDERKEKVSLAVVDFGSLSYLPSNFATYRRKMDKSLVEGDYKTFKQLCITLDLFSPSVEEEHFQNIYEYMRCQTEPMRCKVYHYDESHKTSCMNIPFASVKQMNLRSHLYSMVRLGHSINTMLTSLNCELMYQRLYFDLDEDSSA